MKVACGSSLFGHLLYLKSMIDHFPRTLITRARLAILLENTFPEKGFSTLIYGLLVASFW